MAVTSKELPPQQQHERPGAVAVSYRVLYAAILILAAFAIYLLVGVAVDWARVKIDDLRYGDPRTTHLSGFVNHGEEQGQPTHFVAINLDRQVVVLELPGGDASQVRHLPGPYLFGEHEDLTPISLVLHDMDNDGYNDLLIEVHNEQVLYLNKDGAFRLPTPEEQGLLAQEHSQ